MRAASRLLVIRGMHRHDRLGNDRAAIHLGAHEMHRAAGKAHARRERLALCVEAGESGQQRGMDVDHAVAPRLDKTRVEKPHEAGETDKLNAGGAQLRTGCRGKLAAATMRDSHGGDAAAAALVRPAASARLLMTSAISAG